MYPKNAASPPRIAIGAVVQIADGAVQTSGVSVVVRPEGGAEAAGGGTIAYSAASGVVYYTPTQAETNYTAFCVIAYKSACIPAQVTVVTTASSTAGTAVLDPASRAAILTQELIESYAADGAAPTVAQALMMILQHAQQKSVTDTTVTIKKLDKSTTAATYTLDSATDPTSITRAT